jgi:CHAT domain-containing protein
MARKWHSFFSKVQSFLNRGCKFILISIFTTITLLNLQGGSPARGQYLKNEQFTPLPLARGGGQGGGVNSGGQEQFTPIAYQPGAETVAQTQSSAEEMRLEEGRYFYERLRFAESETAWQAAVQLLSGEEKALGFSYLALAQLRQSKLDAATTSIQESCRLLNQVMTLGNSERTQTIHARILTTYAQVNLARNQPELIAQALQQLAEATTIYQQLNQEKWVIASQINQAQAMRQLGMYREALKTLKDLEDRILNPNQVDDPAIRLSGILNLGKTYRAIGVLDQSYCVLEAGPENPEINLELGNTARAIGNRIKDQLDSIKDEQPDPIFTQEEPSTCELNVESGTSVNAWYFYRKARNLYQQSLKSTEVKAETQVQAMVNDLSLAVELKDSEELEEETKSNFEREAKELAPQVLQLIEILPLNREKVYDRIHLARSLARLNQELSQKQLETALAEARELADQRAESYAIGELGWMKQQQGNWTEAEQWTREAVAVTPPDAIDIRYQWEWQLGQILKEEGRTEAAIRHYTEAVDLLQQVRQNLVAIAAGMGEMNADLQFDFRDRVEPVYRELVGLLLDPQGNEATRQDHIQTALGVIELLQVAELENFLQCDLQPEPQVQLARSVAEAKQKVAEKLAEIHKKDSKASVIYPIMLRDKLAVLFSPSTSNIIECSLINYSSKKINALIKEFRNSLAVTDDYTSHQKNSFQIHELIIHPFSSKIKPQSSLIFVLETPWQNIPMSALYNNETNKYLIQTNSVSLVNSLQLLNLDERNTELTALAAALVNEQNRWVRGILFAPLIKVKNEVEKIKEIIPKSVSLISPNFTAKSIKNNLENSNFSILHLATHGYFSSRPNLTFILDEESFINVDGLGTLLQNTTNLSASNLELLVMSACQTAKGDRRSPLGLAGIAAKGEARSTIASLWIVDDEATFQLMSQFYAELTNNLENQSQFNLAKALQNAQKTFIEDPTFDDYWIHPAYWSGFVAIGNWL